MSFKIAETAMQEKNPHMPDLHHKWAFVEQFFKDF